jgi:hypothetical protein
VDRLREQPRGCESGFERASSAALPQATHASVRPAAPWRLPHYGGRHMEAGSVSLMDTDMHKRRKDERADEAVALADYYTGEQCAAALGLKFRTFTLGSIRASIAIRSTRDAAVLLQANRRAMASRPRASDRDSTSAAAGEGSTMKVRSLIKRDARARSPREHRKRPPRRRRRAG